MLSKGGCDKEVIWILCIYKWVINGGRLDFAARKSNEHVSMEKECDYVRRKIMFVVKLFFELRNPSKHFKRKIFNLSHVYFSISVQNSTSGSKSTLHYIPQPRLLESGDWSCSPDRQS